MSHSDYKTVLRLPSTLEEYLKSLCKDYGLSINEAVKHCIIEHKRRTDLLLGSTTHSTTGSTTPTIVPQESSTTSSTIAEKSSTTHSTMIPKIEVRAEVLKNESSTTHSTNSSTTSSTIQSPQGAPYILYILNNNKYKLIISDPTLSEAWDDWCNYCKSKRKTIKDSQLKQAFRDFETIYAVEGLDGIIDRLNRAISSGYVGWYFGNKTLEAKPVTVTNGNFTEDDF